MSTIRKNTLTFPALMNEIFKPDWFGGIENTTAGLPPVNIKENEKDYQLQLAVPGLKKEDFSIEVDANVLTISTEIASDNEKEAENFSRREFRVRSFKRAFTLPDTVNEEEIKADYNAGILAFTLPKREEALPKPKRLIALK